MSGVYLGQCFLQLFDAPFGGLQLTAYHSDHLVESIALEFVRYPAGHVRGRMEVIGQRRDVRVLPLDGTSIVKVK